MFSGGRPAATGAHCDTKLTMPEGNAELPDEGMPDDFHDWETMGDTDTEEEE